MCFNRHMLCRALLASALALVGMFAHSHGARAAAVSVEDIYGPSGVASRTLFYNGAPAEANDVTVTFEVGVVRIVDAGASIVVGDRCSSVDANEVLCSTRGVREFNASLGDLNDSVTAPVGGTCELFAPGGAQCFVSVLVGGPGNDVLIGSEGLNLLLGGPGEDILEGGVNPDTLVGGPGADTLRGGGGSDQVIYRGRRGPVTADPDGVADDGEPGEGDMIATDVEEIFGGLGNDVLTGNGHRNVLVWGRGNDVIRGKDGRDRLVGGSGADTFFARDGFADRIEGGGGTDRAAVDRLLDKLSRIERFF